MFQDRLDAGHQLAAKLTHLRGQDVVVLALPRGGVPVAAVIAEALGAPLDLLLVRKLGAPDNRELAIGAIVDGAQPEIVENAEVMRLVGASRDYLREEAARELAELERRRRAYLGDRAAVALEGKVAVVVDDGVATGATMRAALRGVRRRAPRRVIVALPVAAPEALALLAAEADEIVCVNAPRDLGGVGAFYRDFRQTSDAEVIRLLDEAARASERAKA